MEQQVGLEIVIGFCCGPGLAKYSKFLTIFI
jgi:hypothetical protein